MRLGTWIGIGLFAVAGIGCGGGGSKPASYSAVAANVAHPTGTLAATNADDVAKAYQASISAQTPAGRRLEQKISAQTAAVTEPCDSSGSISVNVSQANSNAVSENFTYNNCCETADCCYTGGGNVYVDESAAAAGSICYSVQLSGTCSTIPVNESFSFCENGSTGSINYLVEVGGDSFAISATTATYADGSGMLTITGKNGTFTCTYTNYTGSCTGTSGTFTF